MRKSLWMVAATTMFMIFPPWAAGQGINITGEWVLDRKESDINSASSLMVREDFNARSPQDVEISERERGVETISGNRPGPGIAPKKLPEGNFPGKSNWEDLELTLAITQSEDELKIIHRYTYEFEDKHITQTFSLNGSEDYNVMRSGRGRYLSETTVEKDKIVNQGRHEVSAPDGFTSWLVREEYTLSDSGRTLILRANRSVPDREISSTMVFRSLTEDSE